MGKHYFKLVIWTFFLALLGGGALRILLKLWMMDPESGFYSQPNSPIVWSFNAILLLAVLILYAANRLRRADSDYPVYYSNRFAGLLAILVGVVIPVYMLLEQPYSTMEQGYSEEIIQIRKMISIVLGCLAGISMVWIGAGQIIGNVSRAAQVPALFGSLWQIFMLVTRFNSYTVLTTISDNLLAVMFMLFASLFFVGQARTIFRLTRKTGRNYTIPTGLCTALFGLILVIPNGIAALSLGVNWLPAPMLGNWEAVYSLLMSLYAMTFVLDMIRTIKQV